MTKRSVTFIIGSNVRAFERGMQDVEKRLHNVGRQATFLGRDLQRSFTVPIMAAGASVLALAHQTGQYADRISDLSDVTGISTDSLQEWDFVAKRVGVSTDVIASAFSSLGRRMSQFQRGSGPAVDAAKRLGVEFRDAHGQMRNADDIIMDLIGGLNRMPADLDRAGIGTDLFGRRWEMLAPIIGRGSDNIERMREEAQELGLIMDGDALESANRYREEMVKFTEQVKSAGRGLALEFMPVIMDLLPLAERLIHVVGDNIKAFAELDREVQINAIRMAGYIAAAGPLLILFGSILTAGTKVLGIFRALSLIALKNPLAALAVGATALAIHTATAASNVNKLREELEELLAKTAEADDYGRLTAQIVEVSKAVEMAKNNFNTMGSSSRTAVRLQLAEIARLEQALEDLIKQRDRAALAQLTPPEIDGDDDDDGGEAVASVARTIRTMREAISGLENQIQDSFDPVQIFEFQGQIEVLRRSIANLLGELKPDTSPAEVFHDLDEAIRMVDDSIHNLIPDLPDGYFDKFLPPGSIASITQEIRDLNNELDITTNPERIVSLNQQIQALQQEIARLRESGVKDLTRDFSEFANIGIQAFDRLIFQSEKLSNVWRSLGRQLAMKGLFTLLTGGFGSAAGGFSGGLKSMFRVNDAMVTSKGDVVQFHPDDNILAMKDFSKLMPAGQSGQPSGRKTVIENVINIDGRVLYRSIKDVEHKQR